MKKSAPRGGEGEVRLKTDQSNKKVGLDPKVIELIPCEKVQSGEVRPTKEQYEAAKRKLTGNVFKTRYRLSLPMANYARQNNCVAALQTRTILAYYFSGKFHKSQLHQLAEKLGTSANNVYARLRNGVKSKLLEKKAGGWYFVIGHDRFNDAIGISRFQMVEVSEKVLLDKKALKTFTYSLMIDRAEKYVIGKEKRKSKDPKQGHSTGAPVTLGCDFLSKYIGCSKSTAWRHRVRGNDNNFIQVREAVKVFGMGDRYFREKAIDHHNVLIDRAILASDYGRLEELSHRRVRLKKYYCKKTGKWHPYTRKGALVYEYVQILPSKVKSNLRVFSRKSGRVSKEQALCPFTFVDFHPFSTSYRYSNKTR